MHDPTSWAAAPEVAVRWQGDQLQNHSLAVVNRSLCAHLVDDPALDVELDSSEAPPGPSTATEVAPSLRRAAGRSLAGSAAVTVRHQWPPDWTRPSEGAWVVVQPWEYGAVPQSWLPGLLAADEVWCYTSWVRDCFELSGVPAEKLRVVPLGVDVEAFSPDGPVHPLPTSASRRFLFCGGAISRKGIDVLINAYRAEFAADDDVCLVIKAHGTDTSYRGMNFVSDLHAAAAAPGAQIVVLDADLTRDELASVYRSCTALVHPYRGEGFALPVAEAMACGLPVIVTAGGATADFCDAQNAFLVSGQITELDDVGQGPSAHTYFWIEPDQSSLQHCLRTAAESSEARLQAMGEAGRARIAGSHTWAHAAERVRDRLLALATVRRQGEQHQEGLDTCR